MVKYGKRGMRICSVHIPEPYIEMIQALIEKGYYPNLSEAIRTAVREVVTKDYKKFISDKGDYE